MVAQAGDPETSPNKLTLEGGWHKPMPLVIKKGGGQNQGSHDGLSINPKVLKQKGSKVPSTNPVEMALGEGESASRDSSAVSASHPSTPGLPRLPLCLSVEPLPL